MTRSLGLGLCLSFVLALGCGDSEDGPSGDLVCSTQLPCFISSGTIVACADTANNCFWQVGDQLVSCGSCDDADAVESCTDEALDLCEQVGGTGGSGGNGTGEISTALAACTSSCDCLDPEVREACRAECDTPIARAAAAGCLAEEAAFWECFGGIRCGGFGCGAEGNARTECLGSGGSNGTGGVSGSIDDNNYSRLTGDPVGPGNEVVANLRKTVPVTVLSQDPNIEIASNAYVFRSSTGSESVRWYIEVTNRSDRRECSIWLRDISLKDSGGAEILDAGSGFVSGNVGQRTTGTWTSSCLEPGASAPELGIESDDAYTALASIEIGSVSTSTNTEEAPPAIVRATSYSPNGSDAVSVTVENTGSQAAYLDGTSKFILLDDSDAPLWWSFLDGEGDIQPGETFELEDDRLLYEGEATSMDVYVGFAEGP